jgi:DNA-directed RNA polymerase specialized sigma24 family protein
MSTTSEVTLQFLDAGREADLTARAQMGEHSAFLELVRHYQQPLYRLLYALCLDEDRAAAHTREALVRAWELLPEYPLGRRFFPWLLGIARAVPPPPGAAGPARNREDRLLAAFESLGANDRLTLALRVVEQLRCETIATILDVPVGVAMLRIAQSRGQLLSVAGAPAGGTR